MSTFLPDEDAGEQVVSTISIRVFADVDSGHTEETLGDLRDSFHQEHGQQLLVAGVKDWFEVPGRGHRIAIEVEP